MGGGGTLGLTVSSTILNNVLTSRLNGVVPVVDVEQLASSAYTLSAMDLIPVQTSAVLDAFMQGICNISVVSAPLIGLCTTGALFVKNNGPAGNQRVQSCGWSRG